MEPQEFSGGEVVNRETNQLIQKVMFSVFSVMCGVLVVLGRVSITRVQADIEENKLRIEMCERESRLERNRVMEYITKIEQSEIRPIREEQIKRSGRITDLEIQVKVLQSRLTERYRVQPIPKDEEGG